MEHVTPILLLEGRLAKLLKRKEDFKLEIFFNPKEGIQVKKDLDGSIKEFTEAIRALEKLKK